MAVANPTGADAVHMTSCHWQFSIGPMRQRPQFETLAELIEVADKARARGAKADVALIVDHAEDVVTQLPMIGRILHLLMVDILAVGVAMRRGVQCRPEASRLRCAIS